MAAHVFALVMENDIVIENNQLRVHYNAFFHDDDLLPEGEFRNITVYFPFDATANEIENLIEDQVLEARNQYYPWMTILRSNMIMHDIKRGS